MIFQAYVFVYIYEIERTLIYGCYGIKTPHSLYGKCLKLTFFNKEKVGIIIKISKKINKFIKKKSIKPITFQILSFIFLTQHQISLHKFGQKYFGPPVQSFIKLSLSFYNFSKIAILNSFKVNKVKILHKVYCNLNLSQILAISKLSKILTIPKSQLNNLILLEWQIIQKKNELYLYIFQQILDKNQNILIITPNVHSTSYFQTLISSKLQKKTLICKKQSLYNTPSFQKTILIGNPSSIFFPFPHLGLILIENEHHPIFKSSEFPFYNTKVLASWYAKKKSIYLFMSSLTPSVETLTYVSSNLCIYLRSILPNFSKKNTVCFLKIHNIKKSVFNENSIIYIKKILNQNKQILLIFDYTFLLSYSTISNNTSNVNILKSSNPFPLIQYNCSFTIKNKTVKNLLIQSLKKIQKELQSYFPYQKSIIIPNNKTSLSSINKTLTLIKNQNINILVSLPHIYDGYVFAKLSSTFIFSNTSYRSNFSLIEQLFQSFFYLFSLSSNHKNFIFYTSKHLPPSLLYLKNNNKHLFLKWSINERKRLKLPPFYSFILIYILNSKHSKKYSFFIANKIKQYLKKLNLYNQVILLGPAMVSSPSLSITYKWQLGIKFQNKRIKKILIRLILSIYKKNKTTIRIM
ncbi:MAG: hypothetical protein HYS16_00085 [Deltaproteobacteria bacterium]|nr:MAG: hypothetical protein HYS16_00085 [Deltaproteobacteria bacterium]